jgi:hypothetical protein
LSFCVWSSHRLHYMPHLERAILPSAVRTINMCSTGSQTGSVACDWLS